MRQSLRGSVFLELVSIKLRQAFARTEPEKASRVADDAMDGVVRQPVRGCVGAQRQPLTAGDTRGEHREDHPASNGDAHVKTRARLRHRRSYRSRSAES